LRKNKTKQKGTDSKMLVFFIPPLSICYSTNIFPLDVEAYTVLILAYAAPSIGLLKREMDL